MESDNVVNENPVITLEQTENPVITLEQTENSAKVELVEKPNEELDNPLGLFVDELSNEPPSNSEKTEKDVDEEDDIFFVYEDDSQDAPTEEDLKNEDSVNKIDSSSTLDGESKVDHKMAFAWRGRRKYRGNKVPLSVLNKRRQKKVGDVMASSLEKKTTCQYQLFEYYWPPGRTAELCMLQESVSEYLSLGSFRRKYPNLTRRSADMQEKKFLKDQGLVTELQCDLGLTVLLTDEVYELMEEDFNSLYQEYLKKPRRRIRYIEKPLDPLLAEKARREQMMRKAILSASNYNSSLQKERLQERKTFLDLQTFIIHGARKPTKLCENPYENLTELYPAVLIPGQFQEYYKKYTSAELNYFPLNTALYSTHRRMTSSPVDFVDSEPDEPAQNINNASQIEASTEVLVDPIEVPKLIESDFAEEVKLDKAEVEIKPFVELMDEIPDEDEIDEVAMKRKRRSYIQKRKSWLKLCAFCGKFDINKKNEHDDLIRCSTCKLYNHPGCLELHSSMISSIRKYLWQCMDCKICCECKEPHDEDKMMFCDMCDRGYHTYCVGLDTIPEGRWECPACANPDNPPKPRRGRPCKNLRPLILTSKPSDPANDSANESLIVNASFSQSDGNSSIQMDQSQDSIPAEPMETSNSSHIDNSQESINLDQLDESNIIKIDQSDEDDSVKVGRAQENNIIQIDQLQNDKLEQLE